MADARFTINADSSDQGFDAELGDVLTFRLKTLPVSGVASVVFQVYSPDAFDSADTIARNPPRASAGAEILTLTGATEGQSVSPSAVDGTVTCQMPILDEEASAWIVRCIVNGGMGRLADGRVGPRADLIHERMVVIRDSLGCRKIIASETTQYSDDGWAEELNRWLDNIRATLPI